MRAHLNALSRRLRVPARCADRARCRRAFVPTTATGRASIADALLAQFEDRAARRLLVHEPRPRKAVPPHEAGPRQRDAVGQRRRRAGADRAWPPCGGAALLDAAARAVRAVRSGARAIARRAFDAARGAGGPARCRRRRRTVAATPGDRRAWHARARAQLPARRPRARPRRSTGRRPRSSRGARRERGAVAWVCRGTQCLPPVATLAALAARRSAAGRAAVRRGSGTISAFSSSFPTWSLDEDCTPLSLPRTRRRRRYGRRSAQAGRGPAEEERLHRLPRDRQEGRRTRVQGSRGEVQGRRGRRREARRRR